jgi:F-type H+-transporting ATPase subunit delta
MTNRTAAARYARALFDVALQEHVELDQVDQELAAFVDLFSQYPLLEKVLLNPVVPVTRKRAAVAELTDRTKLSPIVAKLLVLLASRDRLVLLRDLLASYRDRVLDYQRIVRAEVTTATPLPTERVRAIEQVLVRTAGRTVAVRTRVDPSILGGLIARIGDTVYDGSVTRQLERIKERLGAR